MGAQRGELLHDHAVRAQVGLGQRARIGLVLHAVAPHGLRAVVDIQNRVASRFGDVRQPIRHFDV